MIALLFKIEELLAIIDALIRCYPDGERFKSTRESIKEQVGI